MRYATITMVDGRVHAPAMVVGAGNGSTRGMDLLVSTDDYSTWVNIEDIQSIVWPDAEDQQPLRCGAEARRGTGTGVCDRPLDGHGYCDRASDHIEAP